LRGLRKRHILVDTLGHLLKVVVHTANIQDREGAKLLLKAVPEAIVSQLIKLWADGGYRGTLVEWCWDTFQITLEIIFPPAKRKTFVLLPRRWVVERTFAWLGHYRRLSKDYEECCECSEGLFTSLRSTACSNGSRPSLTEPNSTLHFELSNGF